LRKAALPFAAFFLADSQHFEQVFFPGSAGFPQK
jgi:hypothetical protein